MDGLFQPAIKVFIADSRFGFVSYRAADDVRHARWQSARSAAETTSHPITDYLADLRNSLSRTQKEGRRERGSRRCSPTYAYFI